MSSDNENFSVETWVEIIYAKWFMLDEERKYVFSDKSKIDEWLKKGYADYYNLNVAQAIDNFLDVESINIIDL